MESGTVLFVDNDQLFLQSIKKLLQDEPYRKFFAKSSKETLEILKQEKVDVIVTDIRMPDIDGLELLRIVGKMYPNIVKVVVSGYADKSTLQEGFNPGEIFGFVTKPWDDNKDIIKVINQAIESCNLEDKTDHPAVVN